MKIRIEENSLRLRLKQKEVEQLLTKGRVSNRTRFGLHPNSFLQFTLVKDISVTIVQAIFEANEVSVLVPEQQADKWAQSEEEGFDASMPLTENESLYILVEKDFRCLHKDSDTKENADTFPNPLECNKKAD